MKWKKGLQLTVLWRPERMNTVSRGDSKYKGPGVGRNWMGWKHRKEQVWLECSERQSGIGFTLSSDSPEEVHLLQVHPKKLQKTGCGITYRHPKEFGFYSTYNEMFALKGISWLLCGQSIKLNSGLDGPQILVCPQQSMPGLHKVRRSPFGNCRSCISDVP